MPTVSVVVPARNEVAFIGGCLSALERLETSISHEVIVVDGDSEDGTATVARAHECSIVTGPGECIATGRNLGAEAAVGEWLAFVDADTMVRPTWLEELEGFAREQGLVAASSRCRMRGLRPQVVAGTINHVFPRLECPVLPGFNLLVEADTFRSVGGFPVVPNEDTALSRRLCRRGPVGYHDAVLVETSARRVHRSGLTGTLAHYLALDARRIWSSKYDTH